MVVDRRGVATVRSVDVGEHGAARSRVLTLWGEMPPRPRLAIVGSRAALHRLGDLAARAMPVAIASGRSILSGGALGIDAAVHRAALAADVAQLAVLPCGPDRPYPPAHTGLFAAIADSRHGGVLFAQPEGTRPHRAMFVSRNALTVELCDACLVLQADARSGSEVTGRLALRRRKPVAVVIGSAGCDVLVGLGARGLPAEPEAFEHALGQWLRGEAVVQRWPPGLEPLRAAIVAHGVGGATLDQLGGPRAAWALFEAAALGLVVECAPGRWGVV